MKRILILAVVLVAIVTTPVLAQEEEWPLYWWEEGGYYTRPNMRWVALGSGIAAGLVIDAFALVEGGGSVLDLDSLSAGHRVAVKTTRFAATSIVAMATSMIGTNTYFQVVNRNDYGWRYLATGALYGFTAATAAHGLTLATETFVTYLVSGEVTIGSAWDHAGEEALWGPAVGILGAVVGAVTGLVLYFTNPERAGFF